MKGVILVASAVLLLLVASAVAWTVRIHDIFSPSDRHDGLPFEIMAPRSFHDVCKCSSTNRQNGFCLNTPTDGKYYLTSFCDKQTSCGVTCGNCTWPYATSKVRFGCNANLMCCRSNKCTYLRVIDTGPACFVEDRADMPIIDASYSTCKMFTGSTSCGSTDKVGVVCRKVLQPIENHELGPCNLDAEEAQATGTRVCHHIPDALAEDIAMGNHLFDD